MPELSPELIARALAGDERLLRRIVDTLTPILQSRAARALVRRRAAAGHRDVDQEVEDLTQTVFAALFDDDGRALRAWDPAKGGLETFVRVIAEREVSSILRSRRRSPWTEEPTDGPALEQQQASEDPVDVESLVGSAELLQELLARVREQTSDLGNVVFDLLMVEGWSVEDVAAVLNTTPDALYAWRSRLSRLARGIAGDLLSEKKGR